MAVRGRCGPSGFGSGSGSGVPITVTVTNTTNHTGFFELSASARDISGGNSGADRDPAHLGVSNGTCVPSILDALRALLDITFHYRVWKSQ